MPIYKSSNESSEGAVLGEFLGSPGTIAYGNSLDDARRNLAAALPDLTERRFLRGRPLPIPISAVTDKDVDLEEPMHLVLQTGPQISTTMGAGVP